MILKHLNLYGFKSFPERTTFNFEPGVTGIVGPNGCGKSNVVDAVRWTLGEQSAKKLRGREMTDVIFNGSSGRKPLGYCEVSLTFDNDKNLFPVEYAEVCITRRLYRTGESEYMINKQPCRLKDIKELFMDTGIGVDSYSSIEQGKVDLLLNANSHERRSVFEEAAGISRYKAKRKECMAKLERTGANLLRAEDVIRELETRIRSLRRQAGKARRYKALRDEMRELRVKFSEYKFSELSRNLVEQRSKIEEISGQLADLTGARDEVERQISGKENRRLDLDDQFAGLQGRLAELQGIVEASQERVQSEQRRIEELDAERAKLVAGEKELQGRIDELKKGIADAAERLETNRREISVIQDEIGVKTGEHEQVSRYEERLRFAVEEKKTAVVDLLQEAAKRENRLGALSSEKQLLGGQKDRLLSRIETFRQAVRDGEERRREITLQRLEKKDSAKSVEEELSRLHDRISSAEREIDDIRRAEADLSRRRASLESRRDLLSNLDARGEGLSKGVKLLLSRDDTRFKLLADGVKVAVEHVTAVEAALGEKIQALITPTAADAREGMNILDGKGRAIFIPLDLVASQSQPYSGHADLRKISEFVQCDSDFRSVVEYLLGDTYLVETVEDAIAAGREVKARFVTPDGSLVEGAAIAAGRTGSEEGGLIWRRTQIEEIDKEMASVGAEQDRCESSLAVLDSDREGLREQIRRYADLLGDAAQEITALEQDIAHRLSERNRLNKEIAEAGEEMSDLDTRLRTAESEMGSLQAEIDAVNAEREKTAEEIRILNGKLVDVSRNRKDVESTLSTLRIKAAKTEEAVRRLTESRTRSEQEMVEKETALSECGADRERCASRRDEAESEVARSTDLLEKSRTEKTELDTRVQSIQTSRREICEEIETLNTRRNGLDEQIKSKEGDLQELKIKEGELSVRMDDLQESVRGEYDMELAAKQFEEEIDWEAVEARIKEIKQKMDNMGNVNLEAIDELAEFENRAEFLKSQRDDLVSAKANLQRLIQKINRTSREKFQTVFDAVRGNFQDMFRKLFGGGKADVFLEEGEDILEAGIEIIAKPPGKELQSLSLLSGGEKALTAVALLFAIFKSKPSPFCILDEVDAPLDESNIQRFANVLREFLEHSQFLLITHNKKSMGIADCLYGVTMQEPGVSKKIAVRLQEAANLAEKP